jgi:hypothetical protein
MYVIVQHFFSIGFFNCLNSVLFFCFSSFYYIVVLNFFSPSIMYGVQCHHHPLVNKRPQICSACRNNNPTKRQTMIYKILHRKLKIKQHKFHKNLGLNSCSTRCTHPVTLVKNLSHEWGKDGIVITTSRTACLKASSVCAFIFQV